MVLPVVHIVTPLTRKSTLRDIWSTVRVRLTRKINVSPVETGGWRKTIKHIVETCHPPAASKATRIETMRMMMRPGGAPAGAQTRPAEEGEAFLRLFVKDLVAGRKADLATTGKLCIKVDGCEGLSAVRAGFITKDGFCYKAEVPCREGIIEIPLTSLKLTDTAIRPEPYPGFLPDYFVPDSSLAPAFRVQDIESFEIGSAQVSSNDVWSLTLAGCWLQ